MKEYLENKITKEAMIEKIKLESRHYAKRQITWFKKNKETIWLRTENGIDANVKQIMDNL